jgi:cytochrome P450/NADPH-cytochrome P450 reductase
LQVTQIDLISLDDWVSTFHRIPKLLDSKLEEHGAVQIAEFGLGDVATGSDIFNDFDRWQDEHLWSALGGDVKEESGLEVEIDTN